MTPLFAQAVDPVFLQVLDLLGRIEREETTTVQEERLSIQAQLDRADVMFGSNEEWTLAKYALASWIDEMLVDAAWEGREWWSNNVLEVEYFNTRLCYEQFFVKGKQATTQQYGNAMEVFYVCVVLGFRGMYRDPDMASQLLETHGMPPSIEDWGRQVSGAIRLGQGRPPMPPAARQLRGAAPLRTRSFTVWSWLAALLLTVANLAVWWIRHGNI